LEQGCQKHFLTRHEKNNVNSDSKIRS
jgi:hypothetical protein